MIGLGPDKNKKLTKSDSIIAWVTSQEHLQTLQSGQGGRDRREARGHWITHYSLLEGGLGVNTDMEFVKNSTQPDFQAKNFTQQKRVNCDIYLANQQRKCIKYQ